ncbi:MAG: ABC transporter permease, partial [Candidatus Latescibacteria bacterium]|nr:ABC transporter permease [Candidatus Latescibacterota bacterium]
GTLGPLGPALKADFPEIEAMTRIYTGSSWVQYKDKGFRERFWVADSSFWDVFTFPLLKGDRQALLKHPYSIVITETTAQKYFGSEDPIGKIVTVEDRYTGGDYEIVGILNGFLTFTVSSSPFMQTVWEVWRKSSFRPVKTYLLLSEGTSPADLEHKLPDFTTRYFDLETRANTTYHLQPFRRIYLYSYSDYGIAGGGDITYVYLFSAIGALILLIACANFMNLATARSAKRAREVGIRKTVGAHKLQLINQFFSESLFLSFLSLLFSISLIELVLPAFEQFVGIDLHFGISELLIMIILTVLMGFIAGSYPAFFLSSFQPIQVLGGKYSNTLKGVRIREILIVFQFCVSIALIICTGLVY